MNTNFTKNPIVGTPLTPSVIKQINTAVRRYMPIAGPGIRTSVTAGGTIISAIPAPASKKQKDKPLPFEVRYDGTLDDGAGGWKIYLPTEHLVQFDGAYLDPLGDVTPILDANGDETGWYSFDEITLQDDHVWLVISESSGAHTASFANAEDQQAVANICIAEVSYEAATESTPETITIKQSVVGAIVMSSGGGGGVVPDDISTEFIPDPPPGTQPDGDEGKLQIKGFKAGQPADTNTIAEYLMGTAQISGQVWLIVRGKSTGGDPVLGYLPLDALNLYEYAKKTDLPTVNDGTLTIKQGSTTLGTFTANQAIGTTVTIPKPPTPPSGTVNFIADMRWNTTTHTLQKRVDSLNMATGAVTQGAWAVIDGGNTTPISSIIPQSS